MNLRMVLMVTVTALIADLGCASEGHAPSVSPTSSTRTSSTATSSTATSSSTTRLSGSRADRDAQMVKRFCDQRGGPGGSGHLEALENEAGELGGYSYAGPISDMPIMFFDANGEGVGAFHIFSTPQTSESVPGSMKRLRTQFTKARTLGC